MTSPLEKKLRDELNRLRIAHRNLDKQIAKLLEADQVNQLEISRLKKKKLELRDEISHIEDKLLPDNIA